jgi:hypothetical protein
MNRREALRLLATGAAMQLPPAKMLAALREARGAVGAQAGLAPRTLNPHQDATAKAMAEMILPRTETPGAADVGAGEFVDLMLTEWYDEPQRSTFLAGLADVDARSRQLFRRDFVECAPDQQAAILNALGEQMIEEDRARDRAFVLNESESEGDKNFYSMLRWLTLTAYYTSEAGATEELHFEIIPARHDGCVEMQSGGNGPERK